MRNTLFWIVSPMKLGGTIVPPWLFLSSYAVIGHLLVLVENQEIVIAVEPLVCSSTRPRGAYGLTVITSEPQIVKLNG